MKGDALRNIAGLVRADASRIIQTLQLDATTARIEVQSLLQYTLNVPRAYLLSHPEQVLDEPQLSTYNALLQRRLCGEPIAYLVGQREFFGLNFKVTPATLIPRPETELLVELALQRMPQNRTCRILDMGTGSGAIALAIAHARPDAEVIAVDASAAALEVARTNAAQLEIRNVNFAHSDWFSSLDEKRYDLIVSNPPYVAADDAHLTQGDVRFEPVTALASGADGLDDIRRIISEAPKHLVTNGWLILEHGYDQAESVRALLEKSGFSGVFSEKDIAGIERVSGGQICR